MDKKELRRILIEILYATINGVEGDASLKQKITPEVLASVYCLAKEHDLAHFVADFVRKSGIEPIAELKAKLKQEEYVAVYRYEQMKYAFEEICGALDDAKIAYIPLKGSVIRGFYPEPWLRTSCDIDILVHENELEAAISGLEKLGYSREKQNFHDVSLYSPNKVHLELHFNILENHDKLDSVLKNAWDYAVPTEGSRYAFTNEFFAFHMLAHMSYHFISGGCGARSLLDIWIMRHKMGVSYSDAEQLLEKADIYRFAVEMDKLSEQCFTDNSTDEFSDTVLKYIFSGGAYGNIENSIVVKKSKNKSSVVYALKRLFLPLKDMATLYPFLKKAPFLLPFCWVARWINVFVGGKTKRIAAEMSCAGSMSEERIQEMKKIRSRLGV